MVLFHLAFDLNFFGIGFGQIWPRQNVYVDPWWTGSRVLILSSFLAIAGIASAWAPSGRELSPAFWRRWFQLAAAAVLVSVGTWVAFGARWVSFGVLHALAVMTLLVAVLAPMLRGRGSARREAVFWLLIGMVMLCLPWFVSCECLNTRAWNWVGLVTVKPKTEDFVPLLPWMGVLALGRAGGLLWRPPVRRPAGSVQRALATVGRCSLTIYLVHQPLLWGSLWLARWVFWV